MQEPRQAMGVPDAASRATAWGRPLQRYGQHYTEVARIGVVKGSILRFGMTTRLGMKG